MTGQTGGPAAIIDGRAVAAAVRQEVAAGVRELVERTGFTPGLAFLRVGDNPSSISYVRSKGEAAQEAGIFSETYHLPAEISQGELIERIQALNADPRFHAILVQLPLPPHLSEDAVIGAIDPAKDVDGVTAVNMGRLLRGEPCPQPCTPRGVVELLLRSGHRPEGKHAGICGRSNIGGQPRASLLLQPRAGATATPPARPPGKSGRRRVGDVDFEAVKEVAGAITPVPGGVGPMTVAMLLYNTLELARARCGLA